MLCVVFAFLKVIVVQFLMGNIFFGKVIVTKQRRVDRSDVFFCHNVVIFTEQPNWLLIGLCDDRKKHFCLFLTNVKVALSCY